MPQAICLLSVVPMRKEPAHRSEMVSQVLFGEYVTMGEEKGDFVMVTCGYDGYGGWVQRNQLARVKESEVFQTDVFTSSFATPVAKSGQLLYVPYGAPVYRQDGLSVAGQRLDYLMQPQQTWTASALPLNRQTLEAVVQPYLNAPYLWGGKSVFGIDCSGFAQQVFKLFGTRLLRDAYLQAEQGSVVNGLNETRLGDLAFFCNEGGRVTHVGIVLEGGKIVHASGQVRVDVLTAEGIINSETGKQTHNLFSVRRFF